MAERPLCILQVSTADIQGGAEKVAWNLFAAYRRRGHPSWLAVGVKRSDDPDVVIIPNQEFRGRRYHFFRNLSQRLERKQGGKQVETPLSRLAGLLAEPVRRLDYYRGVEDFSFPGTARLLKLTDKKPDILHAHNLHGAYFDLRKLPWLGRQAPVLLTLHDAWLLSGHCAHSLGCERWKVGCGSCPDLKIYPAIERDATAYNWRRKRDIFSHSRLSIATPSQWLMQKVEQSMLAPAVVDARVVPNGIDLNTFYPSDRQKARDKLGISQEAKVLLVTGIMLRENIWKDFQTLQEAVTRVSAGLKGQDLLLIVLGDDAPPTRFGQAEVRFIPFQDDIKEVARYYRAADIYVHAAREDTFPCSVLEALACGTPVVATAVGGIPEQVVDSCTGFLVPPRDAEGMTIRINQLLQDRDLSSSMQEQAAESVRKRFGLERQVDTYIDWYHDLVSSSAAYRQ